MFVFRKILRTHQINDPKEKNLTSALFAQGMQSEILETNDFNNTVSAIVYIWNTRVNTKNMTQFKIKDVVPTKGYRPKTFCFLRTPTYQPLIWWSLLDPNYRELLPKNKEKCKISPHSYPPPWRVNLAIFTFFLKQAKLQVSNMFLVTWDEFGKQFPT